MIPLGSFGNPPALRNPIGFGASDFIELALALAVVAAFVSRPWIEPWFRRLAARTGWSMLLLAGLTIALRLALVPHDPVPAPTVYDEFSHLLVGDTLRHFRLANPTHPLYQFFETFFVLQEPSYSSIYPIGQGLALAFGRVVFGLPWAGVVLSMAGFASLCYWMLRGWVSPGWALIGGLLAVFGFGPLCPWMNNYWGGGVSAIAGCLVFGAVPRLRRSGRLRDAAVLGAGLGLQLLARPYESIFLVAAVAPVVLWERRKLIAVVAAAAAPAIGLTLAQNKQVTGSWTTLPEMLSRYQYGVPTTFTFEPVPVPHRTLTPQQEMSYRSQVAYHNTTAGYLPRLWYRMRVYRFFFLPPLYLGLAAFVLRLRERRYAWVLGAALLFALGSNFYPFFFPHYVAALACVFVLMTVAGLERWPRRAALVILILAGAHFLLWYGVRLVDGEKPAPDPRTAVQKMLAGARGNQLVFVRYSQHHIFQNEWVYNDADIDGSRIVWARDLGAAENERLRRYYPDRTAWLVEADNVVPAPVQYVSERPAEPPKPAPEPPKPAVKQPKPVLKFEEIPEAK
jgi:hypothetical protein